MVILNPKTHGKYEGPYLSADKFLKELTLISPFGYSLDWTNLIHFESKEERNIWMMDSGIQMQIVLKDELHKSIEGIEYSIYIGTHTGTLLVCKEDGVPEKVIKSVLKKSLISLDKFNEQKQAEYKKERNLNGIACPKCGEELMDSDKSVLLTFPPRKRVNCPNSDCGFLGTRIK